MKYLLYYQDGFVKKFPLDHSPITIGRDKGNQLMVEDEFLSREHLQVSVDKDRVSIQDKGSANGTYVKGERIQEASIEMGGSFACGSIEFFLRQGSLDEFKTAGELKPVFNHLRIENQNKFRQKKTRLASDLYGDVLKTVLKEGLASTGFYSFLTGLSQILSGLSRQGSFAIIARADEDFRIHLLVKHREDILEALQQAVSESKEIFSTDISYRSIKGRGLVLLSHPFEFDKTPFSLVYLFEKQGSQKDKKLIEFLFLLIQEIKLLAHILEGNHSIPKAVNLQGEIKVDIVASNHNMRKLIEQAKRFARSDIFILIQGESGTGKELFARMIHQHSQRAKGEFVALNCAAIPENLLESELFGYEKGAFTGAQNQQKGKLEISSDGTLVLDEIGNMSADLQKKMLRAVQEQEFYRLGGSTHITVDLRIISITNENLKELVDTGKFRKDLYYRLVHRMMVIPPLRERREDIPVLINYFTDKYCRLCNKHINGYTIKAFAAMQGYFWDGNVRELENEVNSLINLAEDGDAIGYDLLSDAIKNSLAEEKSPLIELSRPIDEESEKEMLHQLLEKNNWNKSRSARQLNMTYRGLHEKLKRLGITKPR